MASLAGLPPDVARVLQEAARRAERLRTETAAAPTAEQEVPPQTETAGASPGASTVAATEKELEAALQASATGVHTPRDKIRKGQSYDINNPSHEKISGSRGHARRPRRKHVRKACEKAKGRDGFTAGREVGSAPASTDNEQASNGKKCTAAKSAPPAPPLGHTGNESTPAGKPTVGKIEPSSASRADAVQQVKADMLQRSDTQDQLGTPSHAPAVGVAPAVSSSHPAPAVTPNQPARESTAPTVPGTHATVPKAAPTVPAPDARHTAPRTAEPKAAPAARPAARPAAPQAETSNNTTNAGNTMEDDGSDSCPPSPVPSPSLAPSVAPSAAPSSSVTTPPAPTGRRQRRARTVEEKAIHARFMRFTRSIRNHSPPEMQKAHKAAKYCSQQLQVLLDEWITCKGEWSRSTLCERMTASKSVRKHGARVWLTRSQIAQKYNDHNVAMEICSAKLEDPAIKETQTKPHPDAPESEALRLFLVWDSEGIQESEDRVLQQIFESVEDETDSESEGGKKKKGGSKKKGKRSRSGRSSVTSRASSNDSSSEGKSKKKKSKKAEKGKKETKEKREKRLEKDRKKAEKERERGIEKKKRETLQKGKKALTKMNDRIALASKKQDVVSNMPPNLRLAIEGELYGYKQKLIDARKKIQHCVDNNNAEGVESEISSADKIDTDFMDFLERVNLK